MSPVPSTRPLPLPSQPDSVAVGLKTPVKPVLELTPANALPLITPAVSSVWLGAATSEKDLT